MLVNYLARYYLRRYTLQILAGRRKLERKTKSWEKARISITRKAQWGRGFPRSPGGRQYWASEKQYFAAGIRKAIDKWCFWRPVLADSRT